MIQERTSEKQCILYNTYYGGSEIVSSHVTSME